MYIAICDDQSEELKVITDLLSHWQKKHQISLRYKTFRSAMELLSAAEKEDFTLFILDVMMPGLSGLDAAREIRRNNQAAEIIFLTSSPGFAYESYKVHALDYLLKPVTRELLFPILDKLFQRENQPIDGIILKNGTSLIRILFSELAYVEVNGKHLYFNMADGTETVVFGTMREYEEFLLSRPEYAKPHRSYIVNMLQIEKLSPAEITTFSGKKLPVSRLVYPQLQKDYMKLMFDQREI